MLTHAVGARSPFAALRRTEFARLDATDTTYLDFAGAALYPASLVDQHAQMMRTTVLGNPHSDSPCSRESTSRIEHARTRVLRFFDADPSEYVVAFTANTSAAAHLVASSFPFDGKATLVLLADNHNSINGIREYALRAGASIRYAALDRTLRGMNTIHALKRLPTGGRGMFAFPAQSNFSGVQHPLALVGTAQRRGYRVLLDAAAFVPTHPLSLREVRPDFVTVSFYKMFGYPTGVGALIAKRRALAELRRPWFAGGTVDFVSVQSMMHRLHDNVEAFEDGTANFAGIAAISDGLDFLDHIGVPRIARHVHARTEYALARLQSLRNVIVYGPGNMDERGGTIAFNVTDGAGRVRPYEEIEARTRAAGISIRGGCFCNPGAAERAFDIPGAAARRFFDSAEPFTIPAFRSHLRGRAVGALRCSVGIPTTEEDIDRLIDAIASAP